MSAIAWNIETSRTPNLEDYININLILFSLSEGKYSPILAELLIALEKARNMKISVFYLCIYLDWWRLD